MTPAQDPSPESMAAARAYYESYGVDVRGLNWNISRMLTLSRPSGWKRSGLGAPIKYVHTRRCPTIGDTTD